MTSIKSKRMKIMNKLGKRRNPGLVIALIFISLGIYGIVWYAASMEELRKYRGKGLTGLVPAVLIFLNFVYLIFVNSTNLLYPIFFLASAVFFLVYAFLLPYQIEKEINRINAIKKYWIIIGLLPIIAAFLTSVMPYLLEEFARNTIARNIAETTFFMIAIIFDLVWLVYVQSKLNYLWKIAVTTDSLAIPVMSSTDSDEPYASYVEQQ